MNPNKVFIISGASTGGIQEHVQMQIDKLITANPEIIIMHDDKVIYNGTGKEISAEELTKELEAFRTSIVRTFTAPIIPDMYYEPTEIRKDQDQPWRKRNKRSKGFNNFCR